MVSIRTIFAGTMVCSVALLMAGPVHAQERSAATTLETQMTWSTLANLVEAANANSKAANTRMDQSILCNKKFMAYAPGAPGADGDGCIENELIKQLANRMDKVEQDVVDTNKKLAELDTYTRTNISRIDTSLAEVARTVANLNTRVGAVETQVSSLQSRVSSLESQIAGINSKISALQSTVDSHTRLLDAHDRLLSTHTSQISALQADIKSINTQISTLKTQVSNLTSRVGDTEDKITYISNCNKSGKLWGGTSSGCKTIDTGSSGLSSCKLTFSETLTSESNATAARCSSGSVFMGKTQQGNQYWARCMKLTCS